MQNHTFLDENDLHVQHHVQHLKEKKIYRVCGNEEDASYIQEYRKLISGIWKNLIKGSWHVELKFAQIIF